MVLTNGNRREFLSAVAAAGTASLLPQLLFGQSAAPPRRIDVHQHFVSPSYYAMLTARNSPTSPVPGYAAWKDYSPARVLDGLDRLGIGTAMLSITAPGVWFGEADEARRLAREMNEYATARMVGDHNGRFGLFAVLPLPDVEGSLREIEYALDTLHADGIGLLTSYGNAWLGDARFAPVLDELNRRKAVVYVHPTDAACCMGLLPKVPNQMLEYPMDTMRTITSLIVSDTAARCPDVKFIFSHAGGPLVGVAGRLLGQEMSADNLTKPAAPNSRLHHLRRFYYDTAASTNPVNMQALKMLVGVSQIVFGTDAPFVPAAPQVAGLKSVGFSADELARVERDNALALLPRFG
jgi:predicted TIM-barrel fold metal-dependent hydrolase